MRKVKTKEDKLIGLNIRRARIISDMTQTELASKLDIHYQQLQKYESGSNRTSVSKMMEISKILNKPIEYFINLD